MNGTLVKITFNDRKQLEKLDVSKYSDIEFSIYDSLSRKDMKKAQTLKSHWAARLDPFIVVEKNNKVIKAFYSESKDDVIESLIKYLNLCTYSE